MPREIPLTKGYVAIVDDEDYEEVSKYKWYSGVNSRVVYGCRRAVKVNGKRPIIYLHRALLSVTDPLLEVDHINHNGLDNRRENLRIFPKGSRANHANRRSSLNSTSKYLGVSRFTLASKWRALLRFGTQPFGQISHLGLFTSEEAAARAYDVAACDIFGSSANLNFGEYV